MDAATRGVFEQYDFLNRTALEVHRNNLLASTLGAIAYKIGYPIDDIGCLRCIKDGLTHAKNTYRQTIMAKNNKGKFVMRNLFTHHPDGGSISPSTCTDERVIALLRHNPQLISLFEKFPKNWEELLKKEQLEPEVESE